MGTTSPGPDWETGIGYPLSTDHPAVWEAEFYRRAGAPFPKPYFNIEDGKREVFSGPAVVQVGDDGTVQADSLLPKSRHMVLIFFLDENIDNQLERARRWLLGNQAARYANTARRRMDKFALYLRALDGHADGASTEQIGTTLFPNLSDSYPDYQRRNRAKATLRQALALTRRWQLFTRRTGK